VNLEIASLISPTMVSLCYIILVGECNPLCYYTNFRFGNYEVIFKTGTYSNLLVYPDSAHFAVSRLCTWLN